MIRRLGVLVLMMSAFCGAGVSQTVALDPMPPSRAQVLQLMSAMGIQQGVDASLKNMQNKIRNAARASFQKKYPDADAATLKKLDDVFDSTPLFGFDVLSEPLVAAYQKNLSASDVQAGIDFYNSEVGHRLLSKLPAIQREANETGGPLVQQKLASYSQELERKLQEFQADVNKTPVGSKEDSSKSTDQKSK